VSAPHAIAALPHVALVLMGVSGCGKSTLLHAIATQLGCAELEGDEFHGPANVAKMRSGQPLDDADRWPWLDRLGTAVGVEVRRAGVACVACSALKRSYRERLARAAGVPLLFVLLSGDRDEIARRLTARQGHYMPASLIDSQLATLERPATDERALILPCTWRVEDLRSAVLDWARTKAVA
jgi:gluconokinase